MGTVHGTLPWSGQAGERRLYNALPRKFYWPYIAVDEYLTEADCQSCNGQGMRRRHQRDYVDFQQLPGAKLWP